MVVLLGFAAATGCNDLIGLTAGTPKGDGGSAGSGGGDGTPPACTPSLKGTPVENTCGVFVSPSGSDANPGSKESPLATIEAAIAVANGRPIYLCAAPFAGPVIVEEDAVLFGGLDCAAGWGYVGASSRTTITAPAGMIPLRVTTGITAQLHDLTVRSEDAVLPGGSSIALIAEAGADVSLVRCGIQAGNGMTGANGESYVTTATDGVKGEHGVDACLASQAVTPPAPVSECGEVDAAGGSGGVSEAISGGAGNPGLPQLSENGGAGEYVTSCEVGGKGANGLNGEAGAGATGHGTIGVAGYTGVPGDNGEPGTTAQGGGGGGGAKGGSGSGKCADMTKASGASGGTGGTGGCGGLGGKGGAPGGASIGILSLSASLSFEEVTIAVKDGGDGGAGGEGQFGGGGAPGGAGGMVPPAATLLKPGCSGGGGGVGGKGGAGGGGLGGHSLGIAHAGAPPDTSGVTILIGKAGAGGAGVDGFSTGAAGVAGKVEAF